MDQFDIIAPGAFADNIGKEVPVINREANTPWQVGMATVVGVGEDNAVELSTQFWSFSHSLEHRGSLSKNEYDVQCRVCNACSCHQPNRLLSGCAR